MIPRCPEDSLNCAWHGQTAFPKSHASYAPWLTLGNLCPEAFACLEVPAVQHTGIMSLSENSLQHAVLNGGAHVCAHGRGCDCDAPHCLWAADCGYGASPRPRVSWSPGISFHPLLYETREQSVSVMGFGLSLGDGAKCVSLPSCFLKDAFPLPNSSEPGPPAA